MQLLVRHLLVRELGLGAHLAGQVSQDLEKQGNESKWLSNYQRNGGEKASPSSKKKAILIPEVPLLLSRDCFRRSCYNPDLVRTPDRQAKSSANSAHLLRLPDPDHQLAAPLPQVLTQVRDALDEELGPVRPRLVEAARGLSVVTGVEAVHGHDRARRLLGHGQSLVVVDAQVVPERGRSRHFDKQRKRERGRTLCGGHHQIPVKRKA